MSVTYTKKILEEAVSKSKSMAGVLRILGYERPSGSSHKHIKDKIRKMGIDTSHFTGQAHRKGGGALNRKHWREILVKREPPSLKTGTNLIRRALLESGRDHKCSSCGQGTEWNGKEITLQIDHINGDYLDDRPTNLRFLCPNCHSQTETIRHRKRLPPPKRWLCKDCGKKVYRSSKRCVSCAQKFRRREEKE